VKAVGGQRPFSAACDLAPGIAGPGGSFQFGAIDENTQFPPPQNEAPSAPSIGKKIKILSIEPAEGG